jgi:hypothetical protein
MHFKRVPKGHPANPFEAFRQLAYFHGVVELAQKMGIKPGTLYNKADADEETHHQPTLRDVVLATRLTGDMRVLDALNEQFGRAAFDVSDMADKSDDALLELFTDYGKENGEFCQALGAALRGERFTPESFTAIEAEAMDVVAALMTIVARAKGLIDG